MLQKNSLRFLFGLLVAHIAPGLHAAVTISPTVYTLAAGQTMNLGIAGVSSQGVKWTFTPTLGTLTGKPTSAIYVAPSSISQSQTVQITATTVSTPTTIVKAVVKLIPAIVLAVTPASVDFLNATQQTFKATASGAPNASVKWSTSLGTISSAGVYVAPAVAANTIATVTATSLADPTKSANATVILHPKGALKFTTQANGLQSLIFNGVNYNYLYGEQLVTSLTIATPNGFVRTSATCAGTFTPTTVTTNCPSYGGDSVNATVTFSSPSPVAGVSTNNTGTIRADIQITNNSASNSIAQAMLSILGVSMSQYNVAASRPVALDSTNLLSNVNYQAGQFAIWNNAPSPDVTMNVACGWSFVCKHQPLINNIAPGQTKTASFTLRFTTDTTAPTISLAPEAYTAYAAVFPSVVNWPDRRPVMSWFMADHSHQSATNPRGYFNDPTIDASNISAFGARAMAQAQSILNQIQARPVQPQGILIWDLEGQEFIQPTTYIGDPRVLSQGYAPEMDATADAIFALFRNAGLKVGITLRPQSLQWGTTLPAQCTFNSDNNYKDYYIRVDQPLGQKFYGCYNDPKSPTNPWSLIPNGNGAQTSYTSNQVAQVTSLLMSKVAYAHARWGTTLYYVDSTVWVGGAPLPQDIFRALQLAFPDCLFIPEESYAATMGVAMPYAEPKNSGAPKFAPESWRYIYPTGGLGIFLSNCVGDPVCWATSLPSFDIGQKVGDMPIYAVPTQMSPAQYAAVETMIQTARMEAGIVTVTDSSSGQHFSYRGSPSTVYTYPLKMRVYFAADATTMPTSTTYCESGGWQGENACTLNLSGLVNAQIRYYDFNDQLVISNAIGPR